MKTAMSIVILALSSGPAALPQAPISYPRNVNPLALASFGRTSAATPAKTLEKGTSSLKHRTASGGIALPMVFEPNRGQAQADVQFLARGASYSLLLGERSCVLLLRGAAPVVLSLTGDRTGTVIEPQEPTGGVSNYYLGSDPSRWRTGIPHYRAVRVRNVYPGVDELFHGDSGAPEFDFIAAPGADVSRIQLEFHGAKRTHLNTAGDIVLETDAGSVIVRRPSVYQRDAAGKRTSVEAAFFFDGGRASFRLASFDARRQLVIDPVVEYSTYLGGAGSDQASGIALDGSGNAYVTGTTRSSDFPILNSPFGGGGTAWRDHRRVRNQT